MFYTKYHWSRPSVSNAEEGMMKFKLLLLPKIFNNRLLEKSVEKQQDDHVLARLICRFTTARSSIRCLTRVHVQGNCWKLGAWRVASPPPLVEGEKIVGTWMWMASWWLPILWPATPPLQWSTSGVPFQRLMATSDSPSFDAKVWGSCHLFGATEGVRATGEAETEWAKHSLHTVQGTCI